MFVDFDSVFHRSSPIPVPNGLVEYYSRQLPPDLEYVEDHGFLTVRAKDSSEKRIGNIVFDLSEEQKQILGESCSFQDIIRLMNNSQTPIRLIPKDGTIITYNEHDIPINSLVKRPFGNEDGPITELWLQPQPFPPAFTTNIKNDKCGIDLLMERVPNNSVDLIRIESERDKPLVLHASIDTKSGASNLTVTYNLRNAHTIKDLVESLSLYNSLFEGSAFLDGIPIPKDKERYGDPINKKSLQFWEKVLRIEELLDLCFVPPSEDVQDEDVYLVEQIFQSLINYIPTRSVGQVKTLQGKLVSVNKAVLKDMLNKTVDFSYSINSTINLLGQSFKLFCFVGIFGALVDDCSNDDDSFKIKIKDSDEQSPSFVSKMFFLNEESIEEYLSDFDKAIESLKKAKSVLEYLD